MSKSYEDRTTKSYEEDAFKSMTDDFPKYFDLLKKHPRALVGTQAPRIGGEQGEMETFSSAAAAEEYQSHLRHELQNELGSRVQKLREDSKATDDVFHNALSLFQQNPDLIPKTKEFDTELANRFAFLAKGFERRNEAGKLEGYQVPVQGLIDQIRAQLVKERSAAPAAPPAPTPQQQRAAEQARNEGGQFAPQGGIPSQAGSAGGDPDDGMGDFFASFNRQRGISV